MHSKTNSRTFLNSTMAILFARCRVVIAVACLLAISGCATMNGAASQIFPSNRSRDIVHVVQQGDTLGIIAKRYTGRVTNYQALANYNRLSDPNRLEVGQQIRVPQSLRTGSTSAPRSTRTTTVNTGGSTRMTDAERTRREAMLIGGGIGTAGGLIACDDNKGTCAVAGTLIGGLAGWLVGGEVADAKQEYVSKEYMLEAEIKHSRNLNSELNHYNKSLATAIERLDADATSLKARLAKGQASAEQLKARKRMTMKLLGQNKQLAYKLNQELKEKKALLAKLSSQGGSRKQTGDLQRQISQLQVAIEKLDSETQQIAKIDDRLTI